MDKLKMHSPDLSQENIAKIRNLFPGCVTEAQDEITGALRLAVDFDQLRQELSDHIVEGPQERYRLDWPGKREALITANAPIAKTLSPCREESVNFDSTKNLFIEGDNLDALKILQETYLGKVKMIYIDPPYNTGNDFVYDDDFAESSSDFLYRSNQKDNEGNRLVANTVANGRFHSDWLSMMYSRLRLAKQLLTNDGIIAISIDDGEYQNVRKICDEIFGEENFIDNVIWKKRYGGGAKEKFFVSLHEYTLFFARDIAQLPNFTIPLTEDSVKRYYTQKDENFALRGPYRTHPLEATKSMGDRPNLIFPITGPLGEEVWPQRQWLWSKERVSEALENGELEFVQSRGGALTVHTKQYLMDENGKQRTGKPFSIIDDIFTQHGTNEIIDIFGNAQAFSFPKPSSLIERMLNAATTGAGEEIILDFFAGSSSTAHACMTVNSKSGSNRRFIMVQVPEATDEKSQAAKLGFGNIAEISKERIRRAGKKILEGECHSDWNKDVGFRVLKIVTSNMQEVFYRPDEVDQQDLLAAVDNIKPDRTPEDVLFQVLVDWGVDLTLPIRRATIHGKTVFFVDDNALAACFDSGITEELVKDLAGQEPLRMVFRDNGFVSDAVKINVEQIFRQLSPNTDIKSI